MKDANKTKKQLVAELMEMRQRIAELEVSEAEREQAEETYQKLVDESLQGIAIAQDHRIAFANQAFAEMVGCTVEELLGLSTEDAPALVHPEDLGLVSKYHGDRLAGKPTPPRYECRLLRKDGTTRWVEVNAGPIEYQGRPAVQVLYVGITERKQTEEALRQSEEAYRLLFEQSVDGIVIIANGRIARANHAFCALHGLPVEKTVGVNLLDLIHPDDRSTCSHRIEALQSGKPAAESQVYRDLRADGSIFWVEVRSKRIEWEEEPALQSIVRDVTERVRAEEALRTSEAKYRTLFNRVADPVFIVDQETNSFLDCNQSAIDRYGYTLKELQALTPHCLHPPEELEQVERALADKEEVSTRRYTHVTKRGEKFPVEIRAAPLEYQDREAWISIVRDITRQAQAEEILKEYSERLEEIVEQRSRELRDAQEALVRREKLATLGQLAGGVSHELRNPLSVISNAVYFLQIALADADETTKEYLDIIYTEIHNSEKIIADLLDFSRTRFPEKEEIAVSDLIARVLQKQPAPENVEVITEIAADLPPVFVDPRQIGQVLGNLAANAYQAMPRGGQLRISAQAVPLIREQERAGVKAVSLSIADTGCGISQENMGKLFEPLFTTKDRGIGLGLTVSKSLVEANGGSIEVESKESQGSNFTVTLPVGEGMSG